MNEEDDTNETPEKCQTCTDTDCPAHPTNPEPTPELLLATYIVATYFEFFQGTVDIHTFIDGGLKAMALPEPRHSQVQHELHKITTAIARKVGH